MPEKDPANWNWLPWLTTLWISVAATLAQYAQKVRAGEPFLWRGTWVAQ